MDITRRRAGVVLAAGAVAASSRANAAPPPRAPGSTLLDAIVVGAGVSGLNAAWLLEQEGLRVTVLEGRHRVGGRVYTLFDQPGTPEMGFNSMAAGYGRGIDAARRASVELYDIGPRLAKNKLELSLDGRILTRSDWARSPDNCFPDALKSMMPWEIAGLLMHEKNPLQNWLEWTAPKNAVLDISFHDFLKAQGLSDAAIHLAVDTSPYYGGSSYDISALMYEFADGWTKAQIAQGPQSLAVKGGNQKLPIGMAKLLKGDLLFGKEVVGIASDATGATATCRDGSSYRAKAIICALPFSTLRHIKVDPALTGVQAEAVETIAHQAISVAFITVKSPFWETDKLSPSMWTNTVAATVIAQRFGKTDDEVTGLVALARSGQAGYWDRLGPQAAMGRIIADIEAIRPAAKGQLVGAAYHSWAMEPFNAGDWAYLGPGQVSRYVSAMSAPVGRIHFCGEHTATANRGLEGAFESSERVALEVLSV